MVHGNYIEEQNITTQYNYFNRDSHTITDNSQSQTQVNAVVEGQKDIADELMPFFFMRRDKVESFLASARDAAPQTVTKMVNQLVAQKEIDRSMAKGDMFEIVKKGGIYKASRSTWYDQVDF